MGMGNMFWMGGCVMCGCVGRWMGWDGMDTCGYLVGKSENVGGRIHFLDLRFF